MAERGRRLRVVGVGDNTVDRYLHLGQMFPGGNAVNVAVFARRFGHDAAYVGAIAEDERGNLLRDALTAEGLDLSHLRIVPGVTSYSDVSLVDGDRVFTGSLRGVSVPLVLTEDDLTFIAAHDLVHTSIYSDIESQLLRLRHAARFLAYDFSDEWDEAMLERVIPQVDASLLSTADHPRDTVLALLDRLRDTNLQLIVATRGSDPAIVQVGGERYEQGPVETEVVDTLGAGDAFAARLLAEHLLGTEIRAALALAAQSAAEACTYLGAWGHGAELDR